MKWRNPVFVILLLCLSGTPASFAQSGSFSSVTASSPSDPSVSVPIFAIGRVSNVASVSTSDPSNGDNYAMQFNRIGATVTIAGITVDPSNAVNGAFVVCGPPTPGCSLPTTYGFTFISPGLNFSASGPSPLGATSTARPNCPLTPTAYFSFCGDPLTGAGLASTSVKALV